MVSRIVWHLVSNRWNSAVTEFAISAARALEGLGYQNIISPKNQSPAHNLALRHGFLVKPLEDFKFKRVPRLLKLKQDIKPDILIVYGWHETFLSKFLMSREVKIFRFRGHEGGPLKRGMLDQWAQRWAHSHVTGLVAPSYISQRAWSKLTPSRPMVPITLGKDTGRYRYCRLKVLERPRLMILGRLDPIKGHRHFLQIFRLLLNNWDPSLPKPQLEIVGEEQNISYAELEGWVCNAGLKSGDDVILTKGRVPLEGVFERASLGVICSLGSEFICRVGEEFLLSGTPIVEEFFTHPARIPPQWHADCGLRRRVPRRPAFRGGRGHVPRPFY